MFSALMFGSGVAACRELEQAAVHARNEVCIYKTMYRFPQPYELTRLLHVFTPDVVFLDIAPMADATVLAREIHAIRPEAAVVGFAQACEVQQVLEVMRAGVAEILLTPITTEKIRNSIRLIVQKAESEARDNLLAFLPAKAGSGATTVALNVAGCLALELDQKVLTIEADLGSGLLSVLLKLSPENSILDALENASRLDGTLWSRIVVKAYSLDLLVSPRPVRPPEISWSQYHRLLQFAQPRYDTVVVDLPEAVTDATVEMVRKAKCVFIVCTPELPSLYLARQRRHELRAREVPADRIGIILNRWHKHDMELAEIEQFLQGPLLAVFQNDYQCVRRAILDGRLIGRKSQLGRSFSAFARVLAQACAPNPQREFKFSSQTAAVPTRIPREA